MILFLYFGLDGSCDLFIDFSRVQYIARIFSNSPSVLIHCLRVLVYFPKETERMESLMNLAKKIKHVSLSESFFLWQFTRVNLVRQTTTIQAAAIRSSTLKIASRELANAMKQFWTDNDAQILHMRWMAQRRAGLESQWREILEEFPNSGEAHRGYAEFLLESCCNFSETARMKCKTERIENHQWRALDKCFISFVRLFPQYIKHDIMNHHGMFTHRGTAESQGSSRLSGGIDSFDINFAPEAYLDAGSLKYAQLRLALEQPLRKVRTAAHLYLVRLSAGTFIFHVALAIGMIVGLYDSAVGWTSYSRSISKCRVATDEATMLLLLQFANVTSRLRPIYDEAT
jgi:uncharacterized damage-inducible protein DinB